MVMIFYSFKKVKGYPET